MQLKFEAGNDKKYEINGIWDSAVYAKKSTTGQLSGFYYLVLWKRYPEEKNIWESALAIQHLQRLITAYYKDNLEKPIVIFFPVNTALPIARPTRASKKQGQPTGPTAAVTKKRGRLVGSTTTNKQIKKS